MGIHDRDYYREEMRKRERQTSFDPAKTIYNPKEFRGQRTAGSRSSVWYTLVRTLILCLAVYGALSLIRDYRAGLKPWVKLNPDRVERLLPYLTGQ